MWKRHGANKEINPKSYRSHFEVSKLTASSQLNWSENDTLTPALNQHRVTMQSVNISPAQIFEKACLGKGSNDKSLTTLRRGKLILEEGKAETAFRRLQKLCNSLLTLSWLDLALWRHFFWSSLMERNDKSLDKLNLNSNEIFKLDSETLYVTLFTL